MTDIDIARSIKAKHILKVARKLGLNDDEIEQYGNYKAKINLNEKRSGQGKLVLVTAINPTKAGIGKTTVSIGLADAFTLAKESVCLALREPSLGPVFGTKGGATGGGYSQIIPMEDINLHFNGDFHAITSANNLLCSFVDNHIFQGNALNVDKVFIKRCLDVNERALRDVTLNSAGARKEEFIITSASEVMAVLCMAESLEDLKARLGNILVAIDKQGRPLYARDFHAEDAMTILLKDAIKPNLVQTLAGTPAIVHCGPFANIAHGCNSVQATKLAISLADYVITEAGFGADLGAEKFIDFKCRVSGLKPDCVVLVATIKALKLHGGVKEDCLDAEDLTALEKGLSNLLHHLKVIKDVYKLPVVVTLNKYTTDTPNEVSLVQKLCPENVVVNDVWAKGGYGAKELMSAVKDKCETKHVVDFAYNLNDSIEEKLNSLVKNVYGGKSIIFSDLAKDKIKLINNLGYSKLPIIVAKTQFSLSDKKDLIGAPKDFDVFVNDIELRTGVGFIVAVCGNMLLMPALGKNPAGINMKIGKNGLISGLF